jgi:hypothetical protein
VWCHSLVDPCPLGQPTDDPSGSVTVETSRGVAVQQDRPFGSLTDAQVDRRPVRGAIGTVTMAPPFRVTVRVR